MFVFLFPQIISSPIITVPLLSDHDVKSARIVKGRIEKTLLGEVAEYIEEFYSPAECYLSIKLDMLAIEKLQLTIDAESVVRSILDTKKLKLKTGVRSRGNDIIRIYPPALDDEDSMLYALQKIKAAIPQVIVQGTPNVNRAVINDKGDGTFNLLVEGYNLRGVMTTLGVKGTETTSNHVIEMEKVLGIEAARATIMKEIHTTMDGHGLTIDPRHVSLLADIMTYRGETLGITRFGVTKMKQSVLMLASFEKTADHLFEAAIRGTSDPVIGVSDSIIMGVPIPIGTGLFQMMHQVDQVEKTKLVDKFSKCVDTPHTYTTRAGRLDADLVANKPLSPVAFDMTSTGASSCFTHLSTASAWSPKLPHLLALACSSAHHCSTPHSLAHTLSRTRLAPHTRTNSICASWWCVCMVVPS